MNNQELQAIVEGLLFISGDDGIELAQIAQVLTEEKPSAIKKTIEALANKYNQDEASIFSIQKFNQNKYRLQTKSKYNNYLARLKILNNLINLPLLQLKCFQLLLMMDQFLVMKLT